METWTALVESPDHVCARYRLRPFHPVFADHGIHLDSVAFPTTLLGRFQLGWKLGGQPLLIQRKLLSVWQTKWVRYRTKTLLFDFDDAVYLRDSYHPKGFHDKRRLRRFVAMIKAADWVIAGNRYLADEAAKHRDPSQIRIIPTCIDLAKYSQKSAAVDSPPGGPFQLVWIGSSSTLQGIQDKSPLWDAMAQQVPGCRFRIICDQFPKFDQMQVEGLSWSSATEALHLAQANVGVSWIPDDPWSRGKCGLKVLQYMAAGLPVVANPVGVHVEMIQPGVTGFLPKTESEWVEAIRWLAHHPSEARQMGKAGRELAEKQYSIQAGARAWSDLLGCLQGKPRQVRAA